MNILFICHSFPFPPNRGGKIRPFNMIRHLSQKHSVVVASLAESKTELQEGEDLREYCAEVIAEFLPRSVRWKQAFAALCTSTPSSVAYFWSSKLNRRIQQRAATTQFDAVFVHCAFVAQYATDLPARMRVLDFGDLDSAKWREYSRTRGFPLSLGYKFEAQKLRQYEKKVANVFHSCTVTAQGEWDEFQTLGVEIPCTTIPNGVDTQYFAMKPWTSLHSSTIVFLGRMNYFPNVDGMVYFANEILPLVRQHEPKATLRIIGSEPARKILNLAKLPGVTVTGSVPDVRPHLDDAAVAIAPLRIARGTQNKVLECMAMGVPVVATPEVARGIQAIPERHLLVANSPQAFAQKILEILRNTKLRENLSLMGRSQVEHAHSWSHSMEILDAVLESTRMVNGHPGFGNDTMLSSSKFGNGRSTRVT